jgi:hypothetical protein
MGRRLDGFRLEMNARFDARVSELQERIREIAARRGD